MTNYLQKQCAYPPLIHKRVSGNLGMIVIIPAYKEEYLLLSLMALRKCALPLCDVEVIIIINDSEADTAETKALNQKIYEQTFDWIKKNTQPRLRFYALYQGNLPKKFAGVGLARKIGMDEACYRFEKARKKKGIIICFDADSRCETNYLQAIEAHFKKHPRTPACSIYFEHPIRGYDYEENIYQAIVAYELHLRYFINIQKWAGFPYAYQTIGSSMAVRADYYQKQGGMNRRKAGEDFYFLHKFIPLGNFTELTTTTVIPSPRISNRVPFGTGKAVKEIIQQNQSYTTYNPSTFADLSMLFRNLKEFYKLEAGQSWQTIDLPASVKAFLKVNDFSQRLHEIKKHTATLPSFKKRFYQWFNAFQLMKFAHFARDHYYENITVEEAAIYLLKELGNCQENYSAKQLLLTFRAMDRKR